MFSHQLRNSHNLSFHFYTKNNDRCKIELVKMPKDIDKEVAKTILIEGFIGEYAKYLSPHEISADLTSWRSDDKILDQGDDKSVEKYYATYFKTELADFSRGDLQYWVQATIGEKLVGWATFQNEKVQPHEVYMNLLVVHPDYQKRGIGEQLVNALRKLQAIPDLSAIHLLIRKKNQGARVFYSKLGFVSDLSYQRPDNFVNLDLLEGMTWKNPELEAHYQTYCGFKPGFLLGKAC